VFAEYQNMQTDQFQYIKEENSEWLKTLELMNQECIQMKTRLSRLLENNSSNEVVDCAEQFQNQILLKEEAIELMKHDLRDQDLLLNKDYFRPYQQISDTTLEKQEQIRKQLGYLENDFMLMHETFNDYISRNMIQP
jgi:hypothetical protein